MLWINPERCNRLSIRILVGRYSATGWCYNIYTRLVYRLLYGYVCYSGRSWLHSRVAFPIRISLSVALVAVIHFEWRRLNLNLLSSRFLLVALSLSLLVGCSNFSRFNVWRRVGFSYTSFFYYFIFMWWNWCYFVKRGESQQCFSVKGNDRKIKFDIALTSRTCERFQRTDKRETHSMINKDVKCLIPYYIICDLYIVIYNDNICI